MAAVIGTQSTVVSGIGALVQFTVGTYTNQYAVAKNFAAKWGNTQTPMSVAGTDVPIYDQGKFHGEGSLDVLFSTEDTAAQEQFAALVNPSLGEIQPITVLWQSTDVTGNAVYASSVVYPRMAQWKVNGPDSVRAELDFIMDTRPAVASVVTGPGQVTLNTIGAGLGYFPTTPARSILWANGLWWFFYADASTGIYYKTAPDGKTWSAATLLTSTSVSNNYSLWGGTSNSIYYILGTATNKFYYRYGTMGSNGTISWTIAETSQTTTHNMTEPFIAVDPSNNIWVCFANSSNQVEAWEYTGSWASNVAISGAGVSTMLTSVMPCTNGNVILSYVQSSTAGTMNAVYWNGSAWTGAAASANQYTAGTISAAVVGNVAYFVGSNSASGNLEFLTYTPGAGFSAALDIDAAFSNAAPNITVNGANIVVFYYLSTTTIGYWYSKNSGATWTGPNTITSSETTISAINSFYSTPTDGYGAIYAIATFPHTIKLFSVVI